MTFDQMIAKIMPEVENGGTEPLIVYRDADGGWHGDFTRNQYGENFDWVEDVIDQDKAAFVARGEDFAGGSMPYVHDKVLSQRLRNEYYAVWSYDERAEHKKVYALLNFFEDNVAAFSSNVTNYLKSVKRPLAELIKMCPFNMATGHDGCTFNEDLVMDAVDHIENAAERLSRQKDGYAAEQKLTPSEGLKEPPLKEKEKAPETPKKKPTLQEKLDAAKEKAAGQNSARNDERCKRKNHDERE